MNPASRSRRIAGALALIVTTASGAVAQPSSILAPYVLFAQDSIHMRTAIIDDGDVGVNKGLLYLRGSISGSRSDFAADVVHMDASTDCEDLFVNAQVGVAGSCTKSGGVPNPIIADLLTACAFPKPFPACNPSKPILVDHGQTTALVPGVYGDLRVEGGGAGPAVLRLNGNYVFCNVRASRNARILFDGPSTVDVGGSSRVSNSTDVGPGTGAGAPAPGEIKWFVQGSQMRFARKGNIALYACAPNAKLVIGSGTALAGRYAARSIRLKKSTIRFTPPVPGVCGDTVISPGEQCETTADCGGNGTCMNCQCVTATTTPTTSTTTTTLAPCMDDDDCNMGSPDGGFVCENGHCVPPCMDDDDCNMGSPAGGFVCEDGHCVPRCDDDEDCTGDEVCDDGHCVTTTTTTTHLPTTSTVTTTTTGQTTTTLKQCTTTDDCPIGVCRDGFCVPECQEDDDCTGSPAGSFVCRNGRCVPGGENCTDCIDNDGDGLIDFEDPDCCDPQAGQQFPMTLKKGRIRSRANAQKLLRLNGVLATSGLGARINPLTQSVTIQILDGEQELLCANIPAGSFVKKRKAFRYSRKRTPAPMGRNIDRIVIKVTKSGQVRYKVKGKRTELGVPPTGQLLLSVGFSQAGTPVEQNSCSQALLVFRQGKRGQLRFP
jgi:hypothetical protein